MYRFVLKNTFTKIYIYHFLINIFIKISSQSYALKTVSLSKTTLFFSMEGVLMQYLVFYNKKCNYFGCPSVTTGNVPYPSSWYLKYETMECSLSFC